MNQYLDFRKRNISKLLQEREQEKAKHVDLPRRIDAALNDFSKEVIKVREVTDDLIDALKERERPVSLLEDNDLLNEQVTNLIRDFNALSDGPIKEIEITEIPAGARRTYRREIRKNIESEDTKLKSEIILVSKKTKSLRNAVINAINQDCHATDGLTLLSRIDSFLEDVTIRAIEDANALIDAVNSTAPERISELATEYSASISRHNPTISPERLSKAAKLNMNYLSQTLIQRDYEKNIYFETLEGRVLAYATYAIELKNIDGNEQTEEDIRYHLFLKGKSEQTLEKIGDGLDEISEQLNILQDKGQLTEDESIYLSAKLKNRFRLESPAAEKPSKDDIKLRAMILEHDFKIPAKKSEDVSRLISDESIGTVYHALSSSFGEETAKRLLISNPEIFYMDNGTLTRYVQSAKSTITRARNYSEVKEFSLEENPEAFASFEALHKTRDKINNLERAVIRTTNPTQIRVMISNKALERASKDGFVSENKGKYEREIASIAIDPLERKKREKIGEFSVSPMGHSRKGFRVAWQYDGDSRTLFICDLLYHTRKYTYVDNWNSRANKEINLGYYERAGFVPFEGKL